jgi:hypothetical protein
LHVLSLCKIFSLDEGSHQFGATISYFLFINQCIRPQAKKNEASNSLMHFFVQFSITALGMGIFKQCDESSFFK